MRARSVLASLVALPFFLVAAPAYADGVISPALSPGRTTSPKLNTGIFDCYTRDRLTGLYIYTSSVQLKAKKFYSYALNRARKKLVVPTAGSYKMANGKLTFKAGPLTSFFGKIQPSDAGHQDPYVSLFFTDSKKTASISCYQVRTF
ncbi:MAG TPA: hypothetical protein VGL26_07190 [Jatrophihabitans sp.]|jgi:hypothetical protein